MPPVDLVARWSRLRAGLVIASCCFALAGWQAVTTVGKGGAIDAAEHLKYAQFLAVHHRLPNKQQDYEYASPPLFQATAVVAEEITRKVPGIVLELPGGNVATRLAWLALAAAGAAAMTAVSRRIRISGLVALGAAALWGIDETLMLCKSEQWTAGQLIALAAGGGVILVTGLIAREIWPGNTRRAVATGTFAAAYPVLFRMSILFHPEVPFAFLAALAILIFLRAARHGWPRALGVWLGAACGAAAITRQPGALLIACLAIATVVLGGRRALRFLGRAAILVALIAGPWWIYATYRWHNPLQSNLELAPSVMLAREPASFYLSAPIGSLVLHPYRPRFTNELLPKLHADLWSDWYGVLQTQWTAPTTVERVAASTQSILGFVADALALGGLAAIAIPAGLRAARGRARDATDTGLGVLAFLAVVTFAVYVVTVARFPQRNGDPIKTSYLLFTTPCWAAFSVAAWAAIRRRRPRLHALLTVLAVLYAGSYATFVAGSLAAPEHPALAPKGTPKAPG